jgi:hypothetical protein
MKPGWPFILLESFSRQEPVVGRGDADQDDGRLRAFELLLDREGVHRSPGEHARSSEKQNAESARFKVTKPSRRCRALADTHFDDLECRDPLHCGRSGYRYRWQR